MSGLGEGVTDLDKVKIENFLRSNRGKAFPAVTLVRNEDCARIRRLLTQRLGHSELDEVALVRCIERLGRPVDGANANEHDFSLRQVMTVERLPIPDYLYVNWYRFDQIDMVGLKDLDNLFSDFWYPGTDDIDLFDESLDWILSVSHAGVLTLLRFGSVEDQERVARV